jgi:uncharacterized membrane protein (UPF0127 family)
MSTKLSIRFVASTPETRRMGLMHAAPLAEDETVLFVFPNMDRYSFWNHNVGFPLSLAWLDENGRVVDMKDMDAQSRDSVAPCGDARYVVEASKGTWTRLGVEKGDLISYADNSLHITKMQRKA